MFRAKSGMGRNGALPRKVAGLALAVGGIAIIVAKVPAVVWWVVFGVALIIIGWKLYVS